MLELDGFKRRADAFPAGPLFGYELVCPQEQLRVTRVVQLESTDSSLRAQQEPTDSLRPQAAELQGQAPRTAQTITPAQREDATNDQWI